MSVGTMTTGFTVWFTGMAGSGKSALANALAQRLKRLGLTPEILDSGETTQMLSIGGGQSKEERDAEARRLAWVCKLVTRGGGIVFQSAIQSPYREARDEARRQIGRFVEVFVDCQIDQLISRDRSGQYKKALSGELKNLPGISEPYEPPTHPEVLVDTGKMNLDESVEHLVGQLTALRYLDPATVGLKSRPKLDARPKIPLRPPPLQPVPQPILYKPPAKPAAHEGKHEKGEAKAKAEQVKPVLKPVAVKAAPAKAAPVAKGKPAAKPVAKPKLVVNKKAAKPAAKAKPVAKPVARTSHPEPRRAAGGRKR